VSVPVRLELDGEQVLSLKQFDPDSQRSGDSLSEVWLPPARELLLSEPVRERAIERLRELCDAANYPSGKTRRLLEDLVEGRSLFGADGYLPALFDLVPLRAYLPDDTLMLFEQPHLSVAALQSEWLSAEQAFGAAADSPRFPIESLYRREPELLAELGHTQLVLAHDANVSTQSAAHGLAGLELAPLASPRLDFADHSELERALGKGSGQAARQRTLTPLVTRIREWQDSSLDVIFSARTESQARRLAALLRDRELNVHYESQSDDADPRTLVPHRPLVADGTEAFAIDEEEAARAAKLRGRPMIWAHVGPLARGVVAESAGFVLVTEEEVFGHRSHHAPRRPKRPGAALDDLRALQPGDFVVHVEHGIGRYLGFEKKAVSGSTSPGTWEPGSDKLTRAAPTTVDLLVVEYKGGDKLFVPVYRMNQIQKLTGSESAPKVDRLGGQTFAKTKAKVKHKVREMADELLRLYAERAAREREPLPTPSAEYLEFEAAFPFEETPDQAAAIIDVGEDLERPRVMDRLVCGDVGFGKTEVALRATFRHTMAGHQVALLCPTTILANQHYQTLKRRFADYPITVAQLSRFESKQAQSETVMKLRDGRVDVVVGTHRLLSKDVHFKRLGLLVVDEEQRFGVAAKERIKQLRTDIDVLTLSATPIPRTLQLAVGKLQDMSVITTPPTDRRAVRTTTARYDENLIADAIGRELERGGQVFYVYNRVEGIYERAARLQALVPRARVCVAHGQLSEALLEKTMVDFVRGDYDILVATAIIESGLDIPRANTLIVDRADLFGLAQLYQLRGRVGRSSERAYCYLLVPPPSELTDEARMRIEALTRYTELGSGLKIAELDLELRGAGNFLGGEQSGAVASVGFELFCQMLAEATEELRGHAHEPEIDPEISIDMEALLPETYIEEVGVRLSLYKRLASALDAADVDRMEVEIEDRFGRLPLAAQNLVELMRLKAELRSLHVLACEASAKAVTLHLRDDTPLDARKVVELAAKRSDTYRVTPQGRVVRRASPAELPKGSLWLARTMLEELRAIAVGSTVAR
jgi:transcription-repair coupling factor (superfamily II helicase)